MGEPFQALPLFVWLFPFLYLAFLNCVLHFVLPCVLCVCQTSKSKLIMAGLVIFQSHFFHLAQSIGRCPSRSLTFLYTADLNSAAPFKTGKNPHSLRASHPSSYTPDSDFTFLSIRPVFGSFTRLTPIIRNSPPGPGFITDQKNFSNFPFFDHRFPLRQTPQNPIRKQGIPSPFSTWPPPFLSRQYALFAPLPVALKSALPLPAQAPEHAKARNKMPD